MGDDLLGDEVGASEVDVDDAVPDGFFEGVDGGVCAVHDACEVEEHVDAFHPLDGGGDSAFDACAVGDIDVPAFGDRGPGCGVYGVGGVLSFGVSNVEDCDGLGTTFGGHDGG